MIPAIELADVLETALRSGSKAQDSGPARVAEILRQWRNDMPDSLEDEIETDDEPVPIKLVLPLAETYPADRLSVATLKGRDAAVARLLAAAAEQAGYAVQLALLTVEQSGRATYGDEWDQPAWAEDDDEGQQFEVGDIVKDDMTLAGWHAADGTALALGALPVDINELSPPDALESLEPDELRFSNVSDYEEASFERTYRRAALVLWPKDRAMAVQAQAGTSVSLPQLEALVQRWADAGAVPDSPDWRHAHDLAAAMIRWWDSADRGKIDAPVIRMLGLLTRLQDAATLCVFLRDLAAYGYFQTAEIPAIVTALASLSPAQQGETLERLMQAVGFDTFEPAAELLIQAAAARIDTLHDAGAALLGRLEVAVDHPAARLRWQVDQELAALLLRAFNAVDAGLAAQALDLMLQSTTFFDLDQVLVPAARQLVASPATRDLPVTAQLRKVCLEHLRARVEQPLERPADWRRNNALTCSCKLCSKLAAFLDDPRQEIWNYREGNPNNRDHIAATVRESGCDLQVTTDKRRRPYVLVCRKTLTSFRRREAQRSDDLKAVAALGG